MTIREMMKDCKAHGKHTFDDDTMEWWGATILTPPDRYGIYIESIDNFNREKKIYCVKAYDKRTGESICFNSIENEQFNTYEEATECVHRIWSQIISGFDHFDYNYDGGVSIVYQDGNEQPIKLEA